MLRVAPLASASGRYGGPFDTALGQARLLASRGFAVTLFAPHLRHDQVDLEEGPNMVFVSPPIRPLLPAGNFRFLMSLRTISAAMHSMRGAEVLYLSVSREMFPTMMAVIGILFRRRLVMQPHGMLTSRSSVAHRIFDLALKPVIRKADALIALTATESAALGRWLGTRCPPIYVVGNPVRVGEDLDSLAAVPRRREAIFIARLHPRKRVVDFIGAARAASEQGWDDAYAIVGPDQGDLRLVTRGVEELSRLRYEGSLPGADVLKRLAQARTFVLPSRDEPWGNVLLASIAIGVPPIISRSSALAAALGEAGVAIVVPDEDPKAIAESVHRVLEMSESEYEKQRQRGRSFLRSHLSNEAVLDRLESVINVVLNRTGKEAV